MRQIKDKAVKSKPKASQAKPQSRMDTLLQAIDTVISKKKADDSANSNK